MVVHPARYRAAEEIVVRELALALSEYDAVAALDEDDEVRRWYLRLAGTVRDFTTIWLTLRERMLHHETYFMPAPGEHREELWRYLLRVNRRLVGAQFCLGADDDVFLVGALPLDAVDAESVDRLIGTVYSAVEDNFPTAIRIARLGRPGG